MANFAAVDLLLAAFGATIDVLALFYNGWSFGKSVCMITGSLVTTSGIIKRRINEMPVLIYIRKRFLAQYPNFLILGFVSMLTLCILSVCRLSSFIYTGCMNGNIPSYSASLKIIFSIWLYSIALSLPPLFGWGRYTPELSGLG